MATTLQAPAGSSQFTPLQYGSSLTIEELTAPAPGKQLRRLVMTGSALPLQGAEWAGENALTTTWYPGNSAEATQQNLGPRELPSSWEGEWHRTLLGRTPVEFHDEAGQFNQIVRPDALRDVFEDMLRGGARLRVTWSVTGTSLDGTTETGATRLVDTKIVREGRAKTWRFPHTRHTDIKWSVEFHWMSRGVAAARVSNARDDTDMSLLARQLEASLDALTKEIDSRLRTRPGLTDKAVPQVTLGQLEQLASAPTKLVTAYTRKLQSVVSDFKRAGDVVHTLASQPANVANTILNFAHNTVAVTNAFVDEMSRIPIEAKTVKANVRSLARAAKHLGQTTDAAMKAAREAQRTKELTEQSVVRFAQSGPSTHRVKQSPVTRAGSVLAVYITKTGDTPQKVSMRFYGTPDNAEALLRANRLPTYTPTFLRGKVLFIPQIKGASARSA